ncbi:hypothetical protein SUGI_0102030 [Cryptomeria japonica]|nr:hypothetical protein SUGI_0102030 [Cryptomeria japonica]
MINFPGHSFDSVNPIVNPSKPSSKIFKEIEDDYVFEIIPASGSSQIGFKMDMELNDINEAPRLDVIPTKRRERPPGSKNNPAYKSPGTNPNSPCMTIENASQTPFNVPQ